MKTKTGNILSAYRFISESEIELMCTSTGVNVNHNDIYLYDIGMGHDGGYGQYKLHVAIDFNGEKYDFYEHSTNSILYDALKSADYDSEEWQSLMTSIFQSVMEDATDRLQDIEEAICKEEEEENE